MSLNREELRLVVIAPLVADWIFCQVVQPEINEAATDQAKWIGTGANWKPSTRHERSVSYYADGSHERQFRMKGKVEVKEESGEITVTVNCTAQGGRRRDMVPIPPIEPVDASKPWPIADVDEGCVREWVHGHLIDYIDRCKKA